MRNVIGIVFLSVACCYSAFSQLKVGARAGIQLTTLTGDDDWKEDRAMRTGINSGIVLDAGGKTAFSTGLLFSTQGVKWSYDGEKDILRMTYLNIPLEVKISLGDPDNTVSGFINAGPYLAVWLKGKAIYKDDDGNKETEDYDFESDFDRRIDLGVSAGGGVSIHFGNHIIQAGPRFGVGFLDVNKYPDGKPDGVKAHLNAIIGVLNVTYLFQLMD